MTGDEYVESIPAKYCVQRGENSPAERTAAEVAGPIQKWAGNCLSKLQYSGSYAKGTGVRGVADVDLFISLKSDTPGTLKHIYESLYELAAAENWMPRRQNVSIGITYQGVRADLVPGRVQQDSHNYHSLYRHKTDSWTQTNVTLHIDTVVSSARIREIRAVKIWRLLNQIDFPSLYLELFVIDALSGQRRDRLAENVLQSLRTIGQSLDGTRVVDPANTNNVLSDELSKSEKHHIAGLATDSACQQYWGEIIW